MCRNRSKDSKRFQVAVFLMWWRYCVLLDSTGWMLQCSHPHTGGRRAVPFGHRVHRCGAGHQASLRRPAGLEDLGQGGGKRIHHRITGSQETYSNTNNIRQNMTEYTHTNHAQR